ncbi:hypothetical protein [Microbacterium marinilacus]|uniref:Uncharacterized protein n=1 Tax=Microbacterium marinilacus TaxID=415209 RepID=A0ABP7BMI7_9MICO|nr:hypothetical protein [Microbacterium marinilacus]MBY0690383.1 hypothetical protein [Microbacterium marinilacus]
MSIILDAGPGLTFMAARQQNVLIQAASSQQIQLAVPQRVDGEIEGKCRDPKFSRTGALNLWRRLKAARHIEILEDELRGPHFAQAIARVSGMPARERLRQRESLGEILAIAHASSLAQQGVNAYVLIDEGDGRRRARREIAYLHGKAAPGELTLWSTLQVMQQAGASGWVANGLTWQAAYEHMRQFDGALAPLPART